jgi:hypothetical protein
MTLVSGLIHSADNCASSANKKKFKIQSQVFCFLRLIQTEQCNQFVERWEMWWIWSWYFIITIHVLWIVTISDPTNPKISSYHVIQSGTPLFFHQTKNIFLLDPRANNPEWHYLWKLISNFCYLKQYLYRNDNRLPEYVLEFHRNVHTLLSHITYYRQLLIIWGGLTGMRINRGSSSHTITMSCKESAQMLVNQALMLLWQQHVSVLRWGCVMAKQVGVLSGSSHWFLCAHSLFRVPFSTVSYLCTFGWHLLNVNSVPK